MAETQNIEYKESWRDEYLKRVCGFANAQGGKIGCNDDGEVVGAETLNGSWKISRTRSVTEWALSSRPIGLNKTACHRSKLMCRRTLSGSPVL